MHKNMGLVDDIPKIIIGNKCDLHADREVSSSEASKFALSLGVPLWEVNNASPPLSSVQFGPPLFCRVLVLMK